MSLDAVSDVAPAGRHTHVSETDYRAIANFLFREARLLDSGRFREWLAQLDPNYRYRLYQRVVEMKRPASGDARAQVLLMDDNLSSMTARVKQLSTPALTIADNPRSLSRRIVSNILVEATSNGTVFHVQSCVLIFRSRASQRQPHVFSTYRTDTIRRTDEMLLLMCREAELDESIVAAPNITAIF